MREYVERQAPDEKVSHAERVTTEHVLGREVQGWDVRTDKSRYWVITSPTNLYSQQLFPSLDYAISFHVGLTARIESRPEANVPSLEKALLPAAWRKWEQAAEVVDEAEEAEDFQSVGMRCRECFVAMVKAAASPDMVPTAEERPKAAAVVLWCELIANHVARGASAAEVRGYLKAISRSGWDLVNWLTHASGATKADAILALDLTQHVVSTFGTALFRHLRGIPDRCPTCGSYRIGLREQPESPEAEPVVGCQHCGWLRDAAVSLRPVPKNATEGAEAKEKSREAPCKFVVESGSSKITCSSWLASEESDRFERIIRGAVDEAGGKCDISLHPWRRGFVEVCASASYGGLLAIGGVILSAKIAAHKASDAEVGESVVGLLRKCRDARAASQAHGRKV